MSLILSKGICLVGLEFSKAAGDEFPKISERQSCEDQKKIPDADGITRLRVQGRLNEKSVRGDSQQEQPSAIGCAEDGKNESGEDQKQQYRR